MTFERDTIVRVPFPFTDRDSAKSRPALVLSGAAAFSTASGHSVLAMITSSANPPWPLDCEIRDLRSAGLPKASKVRFKLFTLDHRLVRGEIGKLAPADSHRVANALGRLLGTRKRACR